MRLFIMQETSDIPYYYPISLFIDTVLNNNNKLITKDKG